MIGNVPNKLAKVMLKYSFLVQNRHDDRKEHYGLNLIGWYLWSFCAARRYWHEGAFAPVWLSRAYFRIECAERHDSSRRCVVETTAFNTAHINVAFVHERFDEERKCF